MNDQDAATSSQERAPAPSTPRTGRGDNATDGADMGTVVAHLSGDRLCVRCHHNLIGQPVYREPRYGLVVARCPECGGATPMLEYPTLGRWAGRLGAVLAAAAILVILVFMLGSAAVLALVTYGFGETCGNRVQTVAYQSVQEIAGDRNWWSDPSIRDDWIEQTGGIEGIIKVGGGRVAMIGPLAALGALWLTLLAFVVGSIIAVFTPGQRGVRLAAIASIPGLIAVIYLVPFVVAAYTIEQQWNHGYWITQGVARHITMPVMVVSIVAVVIPSLVVGALVGRKLARGMVCAFLPPRYRPALSYLWLCDDKKPPTGALAVGALRME